MEADWVAWLQQRAALKFGEGAANRLGDDAAILPAVNGNLIACADMLVDGVHFDSESTPLEQVGRKALAVNLSDLAAMAAQPAWALATVSLPAQASEQELQRLFEGLFSLADEYQTCIVGGDTSRGPWTISVTLLGTPGPQTWMRSGARPGDQLLVTGRLGGSLLGHHLTFTPRVRLAQQIAERYPIQAAIDLSDGLAMDLPRLCNACGCGAIVWEERLPIASAAEECSRQSGQSPLHHALCDGEDFELLLAATPDVAHSIATDEALESEVRIIGELVDDPLRLIRSPDGTLGELPRGGYDHLQSS